MYLSAFTPHPCQQGSTFRWHWFRSTVMPSAPRSDTLSLAVVYQPNDARKEVKQRMYLRFREGAVYGIGFEDVRQLCKVRIFFLYLFVVLMFHLGFTYVDL